MGALRKPKHEKYAFERALCASPRVAAEAAGFDKPHLTGVVTKLENHPRIQARIAELRALDEEMIREKRARIEARLNLIAFGDILKDCATIDDKTKLPVIDWAAVRDSDLSIIISKYKFDKDTGKLTDFERERALDALAQLRQLNGLDAPKRMEVTGKDQSPFIPPQISDEQRIQALTLLFSKVVPAQQVG